MNTGTDRGKVTKQGRAAVPRLIASTVIALSAILVGRSVFDSITGLFLAEAALGGFAGQKFGGSVLPGAVLAFLGWASFVILRNDGGFHGEGSAAFMLMLIGSVIFVISGSVVHLITQKWGAG